MDAVLKQILTDLMEGQTEIKTEINGVNNKLTKIEIVQEEIKTNVNTLVELHGTHAEQNEREFVKTNDFI